jgi:hypothetical protein
MVMMVVVCVISRMMRCVMGVNIMSVMVGHWI